jgi:hypothetical protein
MQSKKSNKLRPVTAKPEQYFILATGVPLKNLKELCNALENMNDWVFNHHVNDYRNDFASWAREVLGEKELAEEINTIKNPREMEIKIMRHLVNRYL